MTPHDDFLLLILSSPSGAGKTTLTRSSGRALPGSALQRLAHDARPPRANEVDGRDYHFVDRARFIELVNEGAFLEWAEVHGNLYGTSHGRDRARAGDGRGAPA